jgi:hypothetical protein
LFEIILIQKQFIQTHKKSPLQRTAAAAPTRATTRASRTEGRRQRRRRKRKQFNVFVVCKQKNNTFQCHHCQRFYNSRRSLYLHQKMQHGGGSDEDILAPPYNETDAPWINPISHHINDQHLKDMRTAKTYLK